jgi:predicted nucleic acid-binding protein
VTPGAPVLVDTSVWVRSWRRGFPEPRARLHRLLEEDRVAGHPFVFGELLVGDQGTRRERLALYPDTTMPVAVVPHGDVVAFVRQHDLSGRGLGWIDCHLLAAAVQHRFWLWTADLALMRAGRRFNVVFAPED